MNTIKTLALATIIIGMASCASTKKSAIGRCTRQEYKTYDRRRFFLQGCCPVAQQLATEIPQGFSPSRGWNKLSL